MNEKLTLLTIGCVVGIVIGVTAEHQRFLREIQNLSKQHGDAPRPTGGIPTAAGPIEETENIGAAEVSPQ
jgi:hypothetical protein